MPFTYAIADLHGRFDLLQKAYEAMIKHAGVAPAAIVHLGDYVDRGRQSRQVVEFLMDPKTLPVGWRRTCLAGNHEDMMVECISRRSKMGWWIGNGGGATLISYGHAVDAIADPSVVPDEHLKWLAGLPRIAWDDHRVFVHAYVDPSLPLNGQDREQVVWQIYPERHLGGHGSRHVVHGHECHADGPKIFSGRTNLDTYAWNTGRLIVGVFDDDVPGGMVDFLEVRAAPHVRVGDRRITGEGD